MSTLRFPRRAHLRASAEFQAVFGEGSRVSGASLRLQVRFAAPASDPSLGARLGLTVGKRVDARAVGRNRIRRVLRETFRLARATMPAGDYVALAKPEAKALSNAALRAEFSELLRRAAKRSPSRDPASCETVASAPIAPLPAPTPDGTMPGPSPVATAPTDPTS